MFQIMSSTVAALALVGAYAAAWRIYRTAWRWKGDAGARPHRRASQNKYLMKA